MRLILPLGTHSSSLRAAGECLEKFSTPHISWDAYETVGLQLAALTEKYEALVKVKERAARRYREDYKKWKSFKAWVLQQSGIMKNIKAQVDAPSAKKARTTANGVQKNQPFVLEASSNSSSSLTPTEPQGCGDAQSDDPFVMQRPSSQRAKFPRALRPIFPSNDVVANDSSMSARHTAAPSVAFLETPQKTGFNLNSPSKVSSPASLNASSSPTRTNLKRS